MHRYTTDIHLYAASKVILYVILVPTCGFSLRYSSDLMPPISLGLVMANWSSSPFQ